ncbi:unnamed protein product [Pleuronectes platessa]|uniref:Uncharacterized protein n=1 Tax=Pleuronectes platessa TaxID=8262 RepID=A0A9N7Y7R0_PLEPL|nr:unnamed protein product [Pleuronectes platessa]
MEASKPPPPHTGKHPTSAMKCLCYHSHLPLERSRISLKENPHPPVWLSPPVRSRHRPGLLPRTLGGVGKPESSAAPVLATPALTSPSGTCQMCQMQSAVDVAASSSTCRIHILLTRSARQIVGDERGSPCNLTTPLR